MSVALFCDDHLRPPLQQMMKIASWNINSLRKRQDRFFAWLDADQAGHRLFAGNQMHGRPISCARACNRRLSIRPITARNRTTGSPFSRKPNCAMSARRFAMKLSIRKRASLRRGSTSAGLFDLCSQRSGGWIARLRIQTEMVRAVARLSYERRGSSIGGLRRFQRCAGR